MSQTYHHALPIGTRIESYEVKDILGVGGFGITYKGYDHSLHCHVAIKEYLPNDLALRTADGTTVIPKSDKDKQSYEYGLKRFLDEARTLAKFKEPNIVRVSRFMQYNGTAYLVMDYEEGESLSQYLARHHLLSEQQIRAIMIPILESLISIHDKDYLHRDIKPGNIYLRNNGSPVLLDFGAARNALSGQTRTITGMVTPGYAPFEQYHSRTKQGPWTDLYAIGATMYRCITGKTPPDVTERIAALNDEEPDPLIAASDIAKGHASEAFLAAIDWMLQVSPKDRPQNVQVVLQRLGEQAQAPAVVAPVDEDGLEKTIRVDSSDPSPGIMYPPGDNEITDEVKAARLTRSIAETGNITAQLQMGLMFARGRGVEKNAAEAVNWFRQAAERGNTTAQVKLAVMFAHGLGASKSESEAIRWYQSAAEQGHVGAQFNLGLIYAYGWGVEKDADAALAWYRKAARQGHVGAQLNIRLKQLHARRSKRRLWVSLLVVTMLLIGAGGYLAYR